MWLWDAAAAAELGQPGRLHSRLPGEDRLVGQEQHAAGGRADSRPAAARGEASSFYLVRSWRSSFSFQAYYISLTCLLVSSSSVNIWLSSSVSRSVCVLCCRFVWSVWLLLRSAGSRRSNNKRKKTCREANQRGRTAHGFLPLRTLTTNNKMEKSQKKKERLFVSTVNCHPDIVVSCRLSRTTSCYSGVLGIYEILCSGGDPRASLEPKCQAEIK